MINEKLAKKYCKEDISKIKNYDLAIADKTKTWVCHHMTETWWHCSRKELIDNECYYNRKACELVFLTKTEHRQLHMKGENNPFFGKHLNEETRRKMSEAHKGRTFTEEHCRNLSDSLKGQIFSEEHRKKLSEANKGKVLSEETRKKISEAMKRRCAAKNNLKKDIT